MPVPNKPQPGQPAFPFLGDTEMWSTLIDMIAKYRAGDLGYGTRPGNIAAAIRGRNTTPDPITKSTLQVLGPIEVPDAGSTDELKRLYEKRPTFNLEAPEWHAKIDTVFPVARDMVTDTSSPFGGQRYLVVEVTGITEDDRYVMVDPDAPTALKGSGESGIFGVVGISHDDVAILDTYDSQNLWRYELLESSQQPLDTRANLLKLDGTELAAGSETLITDPDGLMADQVQGDKGWCLHINDKFYAIQAACSAGAGPTNP